MPVKKFPDEISRIRALLSESPEGLTIKNISEMLGMNRNAAANNLYLLQMQGRITLKRVGTAKIYCQANKLPVDAVLKLSNNGVIVFDRGEAVVEINEQFRELLHLAKQDLVGKTTGQLPFFVESQPELPRLVRDGLKGEENRVSAELVLADRSLPCTLTILPVYFENGEPGVALIADIPAVARYPHWNEYGADDSLAGLDLTEYICRFGPDGTFTYVNQAYGDFLQKGKTELIGHMWRPTVPESEYNKIKQCLLSLDSAHPVTSLDFKVITPRGDFRWQRWIFRNLFDQAGTSAGYQGTGSDITDMKNLEEMVRKGAEERECLVRERLTEFQDLNRQIYHEIVSHEKTHAQLQFTQFAINNASVLIMWANREGRFMYMNREAQAVLGYQHRDVSTKKIQDIIARVLPFPWDEIWETILRDRHYVLETALMGPDGREVPVEMVFNYLKFKDKRYCCCFAKDIAERKRAEEALKESESSLNILLEAIPIPVFYKDREGRYLGFNKAFENFYGKSKEQLISKSVFDISPPELAKVYRAEDIKLFEKPGIQVYDSQVLDSHGILHDVIFHKASLTDKQGSVTGLIGAILDITERKRAEEALRLSEEHYRTIYDQSPIAIELYGATGTLVHVNQACLNLFGIENIRAIQNFSLFGDPNINDEQKVKLHRGEIVHYQGPFDFDKVKVLKLYPTRREEIIWLDVLITPMGDHADSVTGFLVQIQDITDRKRAEAALTESFATFRTVMDSLDALVYVADRETYEILFINKYGKEIFGDISGKICWKSLQVDQKGPCPFCTNEKLLDLDCNPAGILIWEFKNTISGRWYECHDSAIWWTDGRIVRIEIATDITERKQADGAIRQANKKLTLLSNITRHDINNQLLALNGFLKLLQKQARDPALEDYFTRITKASTRISTMIQFTKEYEEIGVQAPIWQDCDSLVDTAAKEAPLGQIMVKKDLPTGMEIFADPLIVKVFYNLMDNAVRYGGKITTIRFSALESGDDRLIVCEDDGVGVPAADKEKIFQRGFGKNTGLGLTLSREILSITGITIRETGGPGQGARFEMVVPIGMWRSTLNDT